MNNLTAKELIAGILVVLFCVGFMGCKENSSGSKKSDELSYGEETLELSWGMAFDYGEFTEGYRNYDFAIFEVEEDTSSENVNSDHSIYLWFESLGASSFDPGTYTYSDGETIDENHLYEGDIIFFNGGSEDDAEFYFVTGGKVDISKDGSTYTLDIDVTLENGKDLKGSFSYDFEVFDESEDGSVKMTNDRKKMRF